VGTLSDVLKSIKSKLVILTPSAVSINLLASQGDASYDRHAEIKGDESS
jgi:hypothetical protein